MKKLLMIAMFLVFTSTAHATYNANLVGNVTSILTYTNGYFLFSLASQPTSNGSCNANLFEVDESAAANDTFFSMMYARLAQAYAMGEQVNVGFDDAGNCGKDGYIQVYRIG